LSDKEKEQPMVCDHRKKSKKRGWSRFLKVKNCTTPEVRRGMDQKDVREKWGGRTQDAPIHGHDQRRRKGKQERTVPLRVFKKKRTAIRGDAE